VTVPQFDLFAPPPPRRGQPTPARARRTDPQTSHDAAAHVPVRPLWAAVHEAYRAAGSRGLTSYELAAVTGRDRVSVSPCLRPMERAGWLIETEDRRPGPTGAPGIVWRIAP